MSFPTTAMVSALAIAPGQAMSVISNGRYAAVIHKALPVDTTLGGPGASLALLTASQPRTFAVRGPFDAAWRPDAGTLARQQHVDRRQHE